MLYCARTPARTLRSAPTGNGGLRARGKKKDGVMTQTQASDSTQAKVLAIDADPEVLGLYKSYLSRHGYEVVGTTAASEGMKLLAANPDTKIVILELDLHSNMMTGEEWLNWFQAQQSLAKIIVASWARRILTVIKGNNGVAGITKPFHMEELQELMEVLLDPQGQVSGENQFIH